MEYTKGEWKVSMGGNHVVVMRDGGIFDVAYCDDKDMPPEERNANAQRIVKAVNCHDDLVEALKGLKHKFTVALEMAGREQDMSELIERELTDTNKALAKAE